MICHDVEKLFERGNTVLTGADLFVDDTVTLIIEFSLMIGVLSLLFIVNLLIRVRYHRSCTNKKPKLIQDLTLIKKFAVNSKESFLLINAPIIRENSNLCI